MIRIAIIFCIILFIFFAYKKWWSTANYIPIGDDTSSYSSDEDDTEESYEDFDEYDSSEESSEDENITEEDDFSSSEGE